jgi:hypothetical protein
VTLLDTMTPEEFTRPLVHPDIGPIVLDYLLQLYAWHGPHHTAHVTQLRARERW